MTNKSKAEILIALEKEIPSISTEILRFGIASHILKIFGGVLLTFLAISLWYGAYYFCSNDIFAGYFLLFPSIPCICFGPALTCENIYNLTKALSAPTIYVSEDVIGLLDNEYEGDNSE